MRPPLPRHERLPLAVPRVVLLVLGLLAALPAGAGGIDVYRAEPEFELMPLFPGSILVLTDGNMTLDLSLQSFSLSMALRFGKDDVSTKLLPTVVVNGGVSFTVQQQMVFSFSNATIAACNDNNGAPPSCPVIQQRIAGAWTFGYRVVGGNTEFFTLAGGFLGAEVAFSFFCQGTCSDISALVPSRSSSNASYTVRRLSDGREEPVECCQQLDGECIVWSSMLCQ